MEYQTKKHSGDSRALLESEMKAFLGEDPKKPLSPFIEFVKKHEELELCFRGNSTPRITIYSKNHIIFTVYVSGKMEISFNHARYCEKWRDYFNILCKDYGFNGKIGKNKYGNTDVGYLTRCLNKNDNLPLKEEEIESIYEDVLKPIFERYFEVEGKAGIEDYFKNGKIVKVSGKTEKKRQQEIYGRFKKVKDGYFFYDLEFSQKHKDKTDRDNDSTNNEPDMQAIRFRKNGKPESIVFVEVKCTEFAMDGPSGLEEHIKKMKKYKKSRLVDRRKEACDIMNQYAQLGLRGLTKKNVFEYDDFKNLPLEILVLLTDEVIDVWNTDSRYRSKEIKCEYPDMRVYSV